jgi:geranylgeranyl diphosphate synthase type II
VTQTSISLSALSTTIEQEIAAYVSSRNGRIYEPIDYLIQLGGKRIRPLTVLLANQLFDGNLQEAIKPAVAVEVFHNFTLMHDDIMDHSAIRRGKPTVHEKWDTNTAILSGDAMMIEAYLLLIQTRSEFLPQLLQTFNSTALGVCEGQQQDMSFETRHNVSEEEYIEMIRLKTSVLLAGALQIGAITAGASTRDQELIYTFGEKLGISFQLWDDYLDTFGDESKVGKHIGGDIMNDKKTFLLLNLKARCSAEELHLLETLAGKQTNRDEKVNTVRSLMQRYNLHEEIQQATLKYFHEAMNALNAIDVTEERKITLRQLAQNLLQRES